MKWEQIIGQAALKNILQDSVKNGRVAHAQLFLGEEGYGVLPLALAMAQEILTKEHPTAVHKIENLNHLDLHFSFPVFSEKNNSLSKRYFDQWREMILENPYSSFDDWTGFLESENKQLFISADEADDISERFVLKSFEGGSKILIMWRADKMNDRAANKILKFIEEPPKNTYIILCAPNANDILPTILSRCQLIDVPRISDEDLLEYFKDQESARELIYQAQGDFNLAKSLAENTAASEFETLFIQWVRNAFQAKKKPEVLREIVKWARQIAEWNREKQMKFLGYCIEIFRLAMLQNYGNDHLVYKKLSQGNFNWQSFSKFIHGANIVAITEEISEAAYHISRNANSKIVLTDMGIKLTRYIHKSPN
ncbi:ATP-binding protein [Chryseobacterium sp. SC28]|uniref:DNA polymerase III subunit n=1 Tax=Chryseobacterium sp. SC28 TaxID=2268028 RepID=UPI000F6542B6|nr:DNA polymerase III subunit delta' [Chryseobacterium sp. SC28]RRQ45888.1 DNA polymerase III subunit delta' [Chryseobacterium sp. SC28]